MFKITGHKGFQMTFSNDVTISVQFGPGSYVGPEVRNAQYDAPAKAHHWESSLAEVAILLPNGDFYQISPDVHINSDGSVIGWVTADEVCSLIEVARNLKTEVGT